MADPCDAPILIVSGTLGGSAWPLVVAYSFEETVERVVIPNEGVVGPSCRGIVRKDLIGTVDFLVKGAKAIDTNGSAVFTTKDSDGNNVTDTLATMYADGYAHDVDRDRPPGRWRQRIVHKGDMSSDPVS